MQLTGVIIDLSWPKDASVNLGIDKDSYMAASRVAQAFCPKTRRCYELLFCYFMGFCQVTRLNVQRIELQDLIGVLSREWSLIQYGVK